MRIGILGWGSLFWDRGVGDYQLKAGAFQPGDPSLKLKIEFSRVSAAGTPNQKLTLVLDERHGSEVPVKIAISNYTNLSEAIRNLVARETRKPYPLGNQRLMRIRDKAVGYFNFKFNKYRIKYGDSSGPIQDLRGDNNYARIYKYGLQKYQSRGPDHLDALIWTDYPSNFQDKAGMIFSIRNALNFYQNQVSNKEQAKEYICNAYQYGTITKFGKVFVQRYCPELVVIPARIELSLVKRHQLATLGQLSQLSVGLIKNLYTEEDGREIKNDNRYPVTLRTQI